MLFQTSTNRTDAWSTTGPTATRTAWAGVLNFSFCSVSPARCLRNAHNDAATGDALMNIGLFITQDRHTAWLLWDDGGQTADDNDFDDMNRPADLHAVGAGAGAGDARPGPGRRGARRAASSTLIA